MTLYRARYSSTEPSTETLLRAKYRDTLRSQVQRHSTRSDTEILYGARYRATLQSQVQGHSTEPGTESSTESGADTLNKVRY